MKMYFICENCGCDELKSMRSPLDLKYGSKVQVPVFSCKQCGDLYVASPTKRCILIQHGIRLLISMPFWLWFVIETDTGDIFGDIFLFVLGTLMFYGILTYAMNISQCFGGSRPFDYYLVHYNKDGDYVEYPKDEQPDFTVRLKHMTKYIKKIKEQTAYKCTIDSEYGAVRVMDYEIAENELILKVRKIRASKLGKGSGFVLMMPDGKTVMGRGFIDSVNDGIDRVMQK